MSDSDSLTAKTLPRKKNSVAVTHSHLISEWADERDISTVTHGSDYKAQWKCQKAGHVYYMLVNKRAGRGNSCPYCSGKRAFPGETDISTTHPHLIDEWDDERDITTVKAGSDYKAQWRCLKDGHVYYMMVNKRTGRGHKCPYCSGQRILVGFNDLPATHPHLVSEWDDERDITTVSQGTNYRAQWKCSRGHVWKTAIGNRAIGKNNCPYCAGRKRDVGTNDLLTTHPHLEEIWDDKKSIREVGPGSPYVAQWRCREHSSHKWQRRVSEVVEMDTIKCPICSHRKVLAGYNDLGTTYPYLADEWNDTEDITQFLAGSKYKAQWKCEKGHTWKARIEKRAHRKQECPYCCGVKVLVGFNDLATTHPHLMPEWIDERDARTVIAGSEYRAQWHCKKGHVWVCTVNSRTLRQTGCGLCNSGNRASKAEKEITEYVESIGFTANKNREILKGKELDIYVPEKKFAIEYNGVYWHSEAQGKDCWYHYEKWTACRQQGIHLFTIWEDDYARNPELVKRMIAHKMGANTVDKVPARKTVFERIGKDEAVEFLELNHLQGAHKTSRHYGLRDKTDNRLLAVLSTRYSVAKKELEISRFATAKRIVQGGFTKLLTNVLRENDYDDAVKVVSYSHNDHSDGGLYEQNGFTKVHDGTPGYYYVVNGEREHRLNYSPKRFRERSDLLYEERLTERDLAALNGLERIWDCGSSLWTKNL